MIISKFNQSVFDTIADEYIRSDHHWGSDLDIIKSSIDELINLKSRVRLLDIGCGPGFHLTSIAEIYPEIDAVGVDYSPTMLKIAQRKAQNAKLCNVSFTQA